MPSSATTDLYPLALHDALPIFLRPVGRGIGAGMAAEAIGVEVEETRAAAVTDVADELAGGKVDSEHVVPVDLLCDQPEAAGAGRRSEEHTSELQSPCNLVCRLLPPPTSTLLPYTTLFRSSFGR